MKGLCAKCREAQARQAALRGFAVPGDPDHPFTGTDYARLPAAAAEGRCPGCGRSSDGRQPKWDEQRRDFVNLPDREVDR